MPTNRARRHVEALLATGMRRADIARRAGLTQPTVARVLTATRCWSLTEAAILAVPVP